MIAGRHGDVRPWWRDPFVLIVLGLNVLVIAVAIFIGLGGGAA